MRFATLETADLRAGETGSGAAANQFVAAVSEDDGNYCAASALVPGFSGDMADFIARMPSPSHLDNLVREQGRAGGLPWQPMANARVLAPLPLPRRNIFCVGKNYHEHAREFRQSGYDLSSTGGEDAPPAPVVFTKTPSSVTGPGTAVLPFANLTSQLDYEAELAVVIGRPGRGISRADALSHVWGYTIVNDVTARDLQQLHRQWFLGKALDTFCPMGPWIVTADALDAAALDVRCWINGELRQNANTRDLIFDIPTIIATISAGITLLPGDVIATGTPAGVGIGFKPPRFLKSGDTMRIEIEGIGTLENTVGH